MRAFELCSPLYRRSNGRSIGSLQTNRFVWASHFCDMPQVTALICIHYELPLQKVQVVLVCILHVWSLSLPPSIYLVKIAPDPHCSLSEKKWVSTSMRDYFSCCVHMQKTQLPFFSSQSRHYLFDRPKDASECACLLILLCVVFAYQQENRWFSKYMLWQILPVKCYTNFWTYKLADWCEVDCVSELVPNSTGNCWHLLVRKLERVDRLVHFVAAFTEEHTCFVTMCRENKVIS